LEAERRNVQSAHGGLPHLLLGVGMMLYGLRTAIYHVGDLDQAKEWYGVVLGIRPYFDEPFYVGFDVD
jgi:hypothetical protein